MKGFLTAVSFLTRFPVRTETWDIQRSVPWFPFVGGVVGVCVAAVYAATSEISPALPAALLALTAGIFLTGGLHEDGLADTADALGAPEPARALEILEDPTVGAYGTVAIVLSVGLRAGAIAALDVTSAFAILVAAHALGRASAVGLMGSLPAAAQGLGAAYAASLSRASVAAGALMGVGVAALATGLWALPAAAVAVLGAAAVGRLAAVRFGGMTGDVLGACEQVVEAAVVLMGAAIVHNGWPSAAWWS